MSYVIRIRRPGEPYRYFNLQRGTEVLDPADATEFNPEHVFELARRMSAAEPSLPPVLAIETREAILDYRRG